MRVLVRVDPTRCRGHGICALMFPAGIELDRWGFGRALGGAPGGRRALASARRAVRACPNGAVVLEVAEDRGAADG